MTLEELTQSSTVRSSINCAIEYKKLLFFVSLFQAESCKEILLDDMSTKRNIQIFVKKEIADNCFKYLKRKKVKSPPILFEYKGYVIFDARSPEIKNLAHLDIIYTFLKMFSLSLNHDAPNYEKWEEESYVDDSKKIYDHYLKDSKYLKVDNYDVVPEDEEDCENMGLIAAHSRL